MEMIAPQIVTLVPTLRLILARLKPAIFSFVGRHLVFWATGILGNKFFHIQMTNYRDDCNTNCNMNSGSLISRHNMPNDFWLGDYLPQNA